MNFQLKLIKLVESNELIYNSSHADYKNVIKKDKVWSRIASTLRTTDVNCRKKWKGLRDTYTRQHRKLNVTESGARKKWRYSGHMSFLDNILDDCTQSLEHGEEVLFECDAIMDTESALEKPFANECTTSIFSDSDNNIKPEKMKRKDFYGDIPLKINNILDVCLAKISSDSPELHTSKGSTALLFEVLQTKIKESKLSPDEISSIESKVVMLVYSEIEKLQKKRKLSKNI